MQSQKSDNVADFPGTRPYAESRSRICSVVYLRCLKGHNDDKDSSISNEIDCGPWTASVLAVYSSFPGVYNNMNISLLVSPEARKKAGQEKNIGRQCAILSTAWSFTKIKGIFRALENKQK